MAYIEREKIFPNGVFFANENDPLASLDKLIKRIWSIPAADVVPVVRCRECIHYETCEGGKDFCCFHAIGIVPDDFCSYGERKEAEGNAD